MRVVSALVFPARGVVLPLTRGACYTIDVIEL
jgi:hypothetical protein